jgi:general secretion pathway protein D
MRTLQSRGLKFLIIFISFFGLSGNLSANSCATKLFSVTISNKLTIDDVIVNLAETCGLSIIIKDQAARDRMNNKLYYIKLKNSTFKGFLNTILSDNDLNYTLNGNKLSISYLTTRTFRIHYVSGVRIGKSTANITIANSNNAGSGASSQGESGGTSEGGGSGDSSTGISIESSHEFNFWKNIQNEIQRILVGATDSSTGYVQNGESWTGPDGQVLAYNPLAPIVNAEAGMVTVTGTPKQIKRVEKYINTLTKQIKSQVLIDVRIISVTFDDSTTSGVDWTQLYGLQNFTINTLKMAQKNISSYAFDDSNGITDATFAEDAKPNSAQVVNITGNAKVTDIVKFLATQGDVKSISSPRVMTLNNQPALISVGKELFYKITSSSTASGQGGAVASQGEKVDSVFAGILLDITPEIDTNGMITLKINPSISDTVNSVASDGTVREIPPDLIRRQIASVIKVRDGQQAILGGLISSKSGFKHNKVPLLGDIPLIGKLFKREEIIKTIEELVLIITPHIVRDEKSVSLKDLGYTKLNEK